MRCLTQLTEVRKVSHLRSGLRQAPAEPPWALRERQRGCPDHGGCGGSRRRPGTGPLWAEWAGRAPPARWRSSAPPAAGEAVPGRARACRVAWLLGGSHHPGTCRSLRWGRAAARSARDDRKVLIRARRPRITVAKQVLARHLGGGCSPSLAA